MRNQDTTKVDYGHCLLIAGSYGKMGCAILAAQAALRSGCGLLTVHLPQRCVDPMQVACPEAMVDIDTSTIGLTSLPSSIDRYTSIAVGPGIGTNQDSCQALRQLIVRRSDNVPIILDADAISCMAIGHMLETSTPFLGKLPAVITPHKREYLRLFGESSPQYMAEKHNLIIVAKSHRTRIYTPWGEVHENNTGNAGMATAGSGDVLTGILGGLLAQLHLPTPQELYRAVVIAVQKHGKIGDIAIQNQSESSLIASDLIENLRYVSFD